MGVCPFLESNLSRRALSPRLRISSSDARALEARPTPYPGPIDLAVQSQFALPLQVSML